jgi:F-type H+-transporting ATPase subunit delta
MTTLQELATHKTVLDDTDRHVARVYAQALLGAAEKKGLASEILEEIESLVRDVLDRDPKIEQFLSSAAVGRGLKKEVLDKAFGGRASEILSSFLVVLDEHDRLNLVRAVAAAYREMYDRKAGRMHVRVTSAVPLADYQGEHLRHELRSAFGRDPILETRIDPDLLGGLVVQVNDWVYDASVRTRLENICNQLIERSSYEIQSGRNRFRVD